MQPHIISEPVSIPHKQTPSGLTICELDLGQMHGRSRNKPCPCKSGRKWKRCHGRANG